MICLFAPDRFGVTRSREMKNHWITALCAILAVGCGPSKKGQACKTDNDCGSLESCNAQGTCRARCANPGDCEPGFMCVGSASFMYGLCEPVPDGSTSTTPDPACIAALRDHIATGGNPAERGLKYADLSPSQQSLFDDAERCGIAYCNSGANTALKRCDRKLNGVELADPGLCIICLSEATTHQQCDDPLKQVSCLP